jgi:hypothetical protein
LNNASREALIAGWCVEAAMPAGKKGIVEEGTIEADMYTVHEDVDAMPEDKAELARKEFWSSMSAGRMAELSGEIKVKKEKPEKPEKKDLGTEEGFA